MRLVVVTPPAAEPITLDEAKAQCRVDTTDDNALLTSLIVTAREYCEHVTRRAFINRTLDGFFDTLPGGGGTWPAVWNLHRGRSPYAECDTGVVEITGVAPLVSVTSITYVDNNGSTQTISGSN